MIADRDTKYRAIIHMISTRIREINERYRSGPSLYFYRRITALRHQHKTIKSFLSDDYNLREGTLLTKLNYYLFPQLFSSLSWKWLMWIRLTTAPPRTFDQIRSHGPAERDYAQAGPSNLEISPFGGHFPIGIWGRLFDCLF